MTVTVIVYLFSANNVCVVSVLESQYDPEIVGNDITLTYSKLRDEAYTFIFDTTNPEGGRIEILMAVNGISKPSIIVTKEGQKSYSRTLKP